ncbi:hypothetical protein ACFVJH_17040 [Streptomyces decoyicus]
MGRVLRRYVPPGSNSVRNAELFPFDQPPAWHGPSIQPGQDL